MKIRPPIIRAWTGDDAIDVDLFAGGGGASEGKRRATGRSPDVAVNHWPTAIAMHARNHPDCAHFISDVYKVKPLEATHGRRCRLLWLSPTCTHFSRASGKALKNWKIRGLAWSLIPWLKHVRPDVVILENVCEFATWGPLHRTHSPGCAGDGTGAACVAKCIYSTPIKSRAGETFRAWERRIRSYGYSFEARKLVAWQYGAPTTRERLYIIMRADGGTATWPVPSHTRETWRTAAEIIDWSIPCPSVFDRPRDLADKTMARIARGVVKFALESKRPFLVPATHGDRRGAPDARVQSVDEPMRTTTTLGAQFHVAAPSLVRIANGDVDRHGKRRGCAESSVEQPLGSVLGSNTFGVVAPMVVKAKTHGGGGNDAMPADEPLRTVTGSPRGEFAAATASLAFITPNNTNNAPHGLDEPTHTVTGGNRHLLGVPYAVHVSNGERVGQAPRIYDVQEPVRTTVAGGIKTGAAVAFVAKHYGERHDGEVMAQEMTRPLGTTTAQDHNALAVAHVVKYYGTATGSDCAEPLHTVPAQAEHHAISVAHLTKFQQNSDGQSLTEPQHTVLAGAARFGLVDCAIAEWTPAVEARAHRVYEFLVKHDHDGAWMDHAARLVYLDRAAGVVIYDIGMRMLTPRELFRANGFDDSYVIDLVGPNGKQLTKTEQVRLAGNVVCPDVAAALVRAALSGPSLPRALRGEQMRLALEAA